MILHALFALTLSALPAGEVTFEPFETLGADGRPLEGRLGRLRVPENRSRPDSATIELAFVHFASRAEEPGPPIVFLIGGPGAPGVDFTAEEATRPLMPLLEFGDVIGIDQRGTGRSVPNLSHAAPFAVELPLDEPLTRAAIVEAQSKAMRECYEHWALQGVDLAAYNTRESAADVDAVRAALGLERVVLWGTSYGSHLGLAYLRDFGRHVERAVFMKVEGPDHTFKLPSASQRQLERVHELVAADPVWGERLPDFAGAVATVLERLEEEPVQVPVPHPAGDVTVAVGPWELRLALALQLSHTTTLARVPSVVHAALEGDVRMLAMAGAGLRRVVVDSAMAIMMDASSWAGDERLARIERERRDPENLLGDALCFPLFPETASAVGSPDLGPEFRGPLRSDVPTLFVSGDLDARTPPKNVEELLPGFPNGVHVLVRGTGHDARELESDEYRALVAAFLRGEPVESTTIVLPAVRLAPPIAGGNSSDGTR